MPPVIYVFALTAFALGLAEFVPIGITNVMAEGLHISIEDAGMAVTFYALGATFSAPILSAFTEHWPRKHVMVATSLVFTAGSLIAALAGSLPVILAARFVAGLGHGLFLAVSSSTAARLAGSEKSGSAVAVVFGGFTLAMAIGVPLSTYLASIVPWRATLISIAVFGMLGSTGLILGMHDPLRKANETGIDSTFSRFQPLLNTKFLTGALVTVFAYAGSFAAYTYIAPMLLTVTKIDEATVGIFILMYGAFAALGNIIGGRITDKLGINQACTVVIVGILGVAIGIRIFIESAIPMGVLVALLGFFSYAAVPALQARLLGIAESEAPHAHGIAAGLNIAGFNFGIALGSMAGNITIPQLGMANVATAGALLASIGLGLLLFQTRRN